MGKERIELLDEEIKDISINEEDEDDDKPSLSYITIWILVIFGIIVVLVLSLIGLKQCAYSSNEPTSSQNTNKDEVLDNKFKALVKKQLDIGLFDEDSLYEVISVSYIDNYPTSFNLDIAVSGKTKIYYCSFNNTNYSGDTTNYSNFAEYIKTLNNDILDSDPIVVSWDYIDVNYVFPKDNFYLVGRNEISNELHFSGFQLVNNEYHVYFKQTIDAQMSPLEQNVSYQIIKQGETLFDYYQGLH